MNLSSRAKLPAISPRCFNGDRLSKRHTAFSVAQELECFGLVREYGPPAGAGRTTVEVTHEVEPGVRDDAAGIGVSVGQKQAQEAVEFAARVRQDAVHSLSIQGVAPFELSGGRPLLPGFHGLYPVRLRRAALVAA